MDFTPPFLWALKQKRTRVRRQGRSPELLFFWKAPQSCRDQGCSGFQSTKRLLEPAAVPRGCYQLESGLSPRQTRTCELVSGGRVGVSAQGDMRTECWRRVQGLCFQGGRNCPMVVYKNKRRGGVARTEVRGGLFSGSLQNLPRVTVLGCSLQKRQQITRDAPMRPDRPVFWSSHCAKPDCVPPALMTAHQGTSARFFPSPPWERQCLHSH